MKIEDHPRVCGEKCKAVSQRSQILGSPPRVRGKGAGGAGGTGIVRITPACAGKSAQQHWTRDNSKDHPRVCGEKCSVCSAKDYSQGSPPRVRGKAVLPQSITHCEGITPACAGKRLKKP